MQRATLTSDTLMSVGYEAATSTLELEISPGEIVQFYNVPLSVYITLMKSPSKGDYYQYNIKAMYESKPVTEETISDDNKPSPPINN